MICPRGRLIVCGAAIIATTAGAQQAPPAGASSGIGPSFVGGPRDERARLAELRGGPATLIRSASASLVTDSGATQDLRLGRIAGFGELVWNSAIPFSSNDGSLWAGRGTSLSVGGGIWTSYRQFHVILAPQMWFAQNQAFAMLPGGDPSRSDFGSPWLVGPLSADIPVRFGTNRVVAWSAGESSLWFRARRVEFGASTESQWWGPGIRNALLVSNNAGGIPHLFIRTPRPLRTRFGTVEAKWILGVLSESPFFDQNGANNMRSTNGAIATLSPAWDETLTIGLARIVYARIDSPWLLASRSLDVLYRAGRDSPGSGAAEQLTSLFGRWLMPASNAEVYGEWSRMLLPASLRSFLQAPQFGQGFTVGAQWLPQISLASRLRFQLEFTNLEQPVTSSSSDTVSFYTSTTVEQGFTHRGQVVGAAIGPGSQSQWLAFDWLHGARTVGMFLGRIRWNTDAYYTQPNSVSSSSYDVSVFGGVRASLQVSDRDVALEVTRQRRLNFLFQNALYGFSDSGAFDKNNITVRLRFY